MLNLDKPMRVRQISGDGVLNSHPVRLASGTKGAKESLIKNPKTKLYFKGMNDDIGKYPYFMLFVDPCTGKVNGCPDYVVVNV